MSSTEASLIELIGVTKRYGPQDAGEPPVLDGLDLRVAAGEALAVLGPSGSGKSTLLHLLGGLDRVTQGRVLFQGRDLAAMSDEELARFRNREVGFVFQSHHLLPQCTALENVLLPMLAQRSPATSRKADLARATDLLERVGLGHRASHRPGQMSVGQCQRVAVARALMNRPRLVLADEPTGALDAKSAEGVAALLVELNRAEGVTLIVATHSAALARRLGRSQRLCDGRLGAEPAAGAEGQP